MSWLLKLYPRRWRRRYGAELEDLVASQPRSFGLAADLLRGAIDARMHPQASATRARAAGGGDGSNETARSTRCREARGPGIRRALGTAALMIGATLAFVAIQSALREAYGDHPIVEGIGRMSFPAITVLALPLYLRGCSRFAKVALMGGTLLVLFAIGVLSGLV